MAKKQKQITEFENQITKHTEAVDVLKEKLRESENELQELEKTHQKVNPSSNLTLEDELDIVEAIVGRL